VYFVVDKPVLVWYYNYRKRERKKGEKTMTNLNKINTIRKVDNGLYINDYKEYNKVIKEDRKNTVEKNPDKKWMLDPFVGYIEKK